MYQRDAAAVLSFGFDGVKLDGCGKQKESGKELLGRRLSNELY